MEILSFTIVPQSTKKNWKKEMKDLYNKNFNFWRMTLKQSLEDGKISHADDWRN